MFGCMMTTLHCYDYNGNEGDDDDEGDDGDNADKDIDAIALPECTFVFFSNDNVSGVNLGVGYDD